MEEKTDKTLPTDELSKRLKEENALQMGILNESVAALAFSVQSLNVLVLSLIHNMKKKDGFDIPGWKTEKEIADDVGKIAADCIEKVNKVYGLSKANKS